MYNKIKNWIRNRIFSYIFFKRKSLKNVFNFIYSNNYWLSQESKSWPWSDKSATKHIKKEISRVITKYNIKSILDLPCGDCNWIEPDKLGIKYIGGDIVEWLVIENIKKFRGEIYFQTLDITTDELPSVDMILCRECLQHLSYKNIKLALRNIKKSQIRYLLTTSCPNGKNKNIENGLCFAINLEDKPFSLWKPIEEIEEIESNEKQQKTNNKKQYLYLYNLQDFT